MERKVSIRTVLGGLHPLVRTAVNGFPAPLPLWIRLWGARGTSWRRGALVDPDRRFAYFPITKAANSTVKHVLWRAMGVEVRAPDAMSRIQRANGPLEGLGDIQFHEIDQILGRAPLFRFTFVRNPFDRLKSAYRQKILAPVSFEQGQHYLDKLGWRGEGIPDFSDFVTRVVRQSDSQMDLHWLPQSRLMLKGAIPLDFVGKVENFDQDIATVLREIGALPGAYQPGLSLNRLTSSTRDDIRYTPTLLELVRRRYADDFSAFGYSDTPP